MIHCLFVLFIVFGAFTFTLNHVLLPILILFIIVLVLWILLLLFIFTLRGLLSSCTLYRILLCLGLSLYSRLLRVLSKGRRLLFRSLERLRLHLLILSTRPFCLEGRVPLIHLNLLLRMAFSLKSLWLRRNAPGLLLTPIGSERVLSGYSLHWVGMLEAWHQSSRDRIFAALTR